MESRTRSHVPRLRGRHLHGLDHATSARGSAQLSVNDCRSHDQPSTDLTVGANININVVLVEPTPAGADVHIDFPGFEQALREARPGQALLASSFDITHRRGLRDVGVVRYGYRGNEAGLPMVLAENLPVGLPDTRGRVQWADLMPRDELVASLTTRFDVRVSAGSVTDSIPVFVTRTLPVSDTIELVPTLSVPRALAINGAPSTGFRAGVGLTPALSWDEPARGAPSRYLIVVLDLVDQNFSQAFDLGKNIGLLLSGTYMMAASLAGSIGGGGATVSVPIVGQVVGPGAIAVSVAVGAQGTAAAVQGMNGLATLMQGDGNSGGNESTKADEGTKPPMEVEVVASESDGNIKTYAGQGKGPCLNYMIARGIRA